MDKRKRIVKSPAQPPDTYGVEGAVKKFLKKKTLPTLYTIKPLEWKQEADGSWYADAPLSIWIAVEPYREVFQWRISIGIGDGADEE